MNNLKQNETSSSAVISILLDSYNDIFSDFDPGSYAERILSDDFIAQLKKFANQKDGTKIFLRLLLPANKRNEVDEKVITQRLQSYFKSVYEELKFEVQKTNRRGWVLTFTGAALMITASYISFMKPAKYHIHLVLVLFEPAGWFLLVSGLEHLAHSSKETKKDLAFYLRMTKSEIGFFNY